MPNSAGVILHQALRVPGNVPFGETKLAGEIHLVFPWLKLVAW